LAVIYSWRGGPQQPGVPTSDPLDGPRFDVFPVSNSMDTTVFCPQDHNSSKTMDTPCHHHGLLERNGNRNSIVGGEDIRWLMMSIADFDKALVDEILFRICLIEETVQAYISRLRQHTLYLPILLVGIGVFLCIHAVGLCLHMAMKVAAQFFDFNLKVE
jgi:hypothetical protein